MRRSLVISLVGIIVLAVVALGATLVQGNSPKLGLDLEGGASVVLAPKAGSVVKPGTLNQAERIISNRVNGLGVAEPNIYKQGNNIVVELPGGLGRREQQPDHRQHEEYQQRDDEHRDDERRGEPRGTAPCGGARPGGAAGSGSGVGAVGV